MGKRLFKKMMAATVYGQFMAGETQEPILKKVVQHKGFGVQSMFQYTASETHGNTM